MIFSNILRTLLGCLSFWHFNQNPSLKKDSSIRKEILKKLDKTSFKKKNLKKTHIEFNKNILDLLKNKDLKNFLRKNFVQKMFFVHNRLFILNELNELKKSKKWKIYEDLLIEDHIGDPIRYFLYPKSSGNRINHVYHLSVLEDELKIDLKNRIKTIFEFGGGYGCMARIFSKITKKIKYTCYDTYYVNLLQYYYLKHNNLSVGFEKKREFYLTSDLKSAKSNYDLFIANWSLSETPTVFRKKFIKTMLSSKYILICFQEKFENINNLKYFKSLKTKLSKKFDIKIINNRFYNGNMLLRQNHYFFIGRKL